MQRSALATLLRIVPAIAALLLLLPIEPAQAIPGTCPAGLGTATIISHDFTPLPSGGTDAFADTMALRACA